jgi:hypothetical protein
VAGKSAVLNIKIVSDSKGAAAGFDQAESRVARFERGLDRASVASVGVLAALGGLAVKAFDAASALQQSAGAVESVFGDAAGEVQAFSRKAAQAVGLAESEYNDLAAVLGAQLKNMGVSMDDLGGQTNDLIEIGADLAATFGGTTSDAVSALGSLLRGERDPIERYGIAIKQADIDARLAAQGMEELEGEARAQAEAQATLALVSEQSAGALGAFAREADTAAGAQQRANAEFENAMAVLGEELLPVVTAVVGKLTEMAQWVTANKDTVIPLTAAVAALAAGVLVVNGVLSAYRAIVAVVTAVQWALNVAMYANPIGLIILAVVALIGLLTWIVIKLGGVGNTMSLVGALFTEAWNAIVAGGEWVMDVISALGDVFAAVFGWIGDVMQPVVDTIEWIANKLSFIGDAAGWVGDLFGAPMQVQVAGGGSGLMGAAAGMRGAPLIAGAAGSGVGPASGGTGPAGMVVNVTVNGALDPVSVGRQLEKVLRDYGRASGRQVAMTMGRA